MAKRMSGMLAVVLDLISTFACLPRNASLCYYLQFLGHFLPLFIFYTGKKHYFQIPNVFMYFSSIAMQLVKICLLGANFIKNLFNSQMFRRHMLPIIMS